MFAYHDGDFCVWQSKVLMALCDDDNEEQAIAMLTELPDVGTLYEMLAPQRAVCC